MRAIRVASAALLGVAALTLTAPPAAAGSGGIHAAASFGRATGPASVAPGGRTTLPVRECGSDTSDAKRGAAYEAKFPCGGEFGERHLAVTSGRGNGEGEGFSGDSGERYRRHGVQAGLGGSIGGFDLERIGLGAALISGSIGAAWYLWRRRPAGEPS